MKKLVEQVIKVIFSVLGNLQRPDLVYFESFHGKQVSDNPLAIYQSLKKEAPDKELVWGATAGFEAIFKQAGVPYVRRFSFKWFLTMPRAKVWVMNTRTPLFLKKNPKTFYIQTWHGTPLKKIGLDIADVQIPGYETESYQQEFKTEAGRWDLLLAPNPYCETIFPKAFGYQGKILAEGYPRNDDLVTYATDEDYLASLRKQLKIPLDKKVILYAPTWRENQVKENGQYAFDLPFDLVRLATEVAPEAMILVRLHYLVSQALETSVLPENVLNVSAYPDMKDILLVTDLLVTDYSSSFFDFAITKRPMLFFIPDQKNYSEELRGLYRPMDERLPGQLVQDVEGFERGIKDFIAEPSALLTPSYPDFYTEFCLNEQGHAAESVATIILEKLREQK